MFGSEYVIDHVICEHNSNMKRTIYMNYTSDMLKAMAEGLGAQVNYRFSDMIKTEKEDTRSGDEIALEVIRKAGLKGKNNGFTESTSED